MLMFKVVRERALDARMHQDLTWAVFLELFFEDLPGLMIPVTILIINKEVCMCVRAAVPPTCDQT